MKNINVMDVETYLEHDVVIPYCICLKLNNNYFDFYGFNVVRDFLDGIASNVSHNKVVIFTHNINFDGLLILEYIKNRKIYFDSFIRDSNIYWIKIRYTNIEIIIRCSYKIIPISVKKMGNMMGYEKGIFPYSFVNQNRLYYSDIVPPRKYFESDKDYESFQSSSPLFNLKEKTIEYCRRDVEIVSKMLMNIIQIISLYDSKVINNSFSFSSISYKLYIKLYDKWGIDKRKNNTYVHNYIKDSYYGGRCEVFGNPHNRLIHYFDFTGMYSQCMKEKFPIGSGFFKKKNLNHEEIGFHTVKIRCNSYLPFIPFRTNKLIFPNGVFTGRYWYEELVNALHHGKCEILDHYSSYVYSNEDHIFNDYVDHFIKIRGVNPYYKLFGKNMNNGLYGSFALDEKDEECIICHSSEELDTYRTHADIKSIVKFGSSFIVTIVKTEKSKKIIDKNNKWTDFKKRNIAYASIIASKARIKLNNALQMVLSNGGDLYYTDTDSIFAGYTDNRLGQTIGDITWSEVYNDAVFVSSKFYYLDKLILKGVNNNKISLSEIKKKFYNDSSTIVFTDQLHFLKKDYILKQKYLNKSISLSNYDKRIFSKNKLTTEPLTIYPDL